MKFSILVILRICGIIRDDTGWFNPHTLMMHQQEGGGSSKAVKATDDHFVLTTVGAMKGETHRAYILSDKPGHSTVNRSGKLQSMSYDYNEFTYNKREWGCDGASFGYVECNAFAAYKFDVIYQGTNHKKVVKFCACCHGQLMKDENGNNKELNEELYPSGKAPNTHVIPPREPAEAIEYPVETRNGPVKWKVAGGSGNVLAEAGAQDGLTKRDYGETYFSDVPKLSNALEQMDTKHHIMNTVSDGDSRGKLHGTTADYAAIAKPGTSAYQSTWPRTREILEKEYPPFKDFFEEIESDYKCKISDGHVDLPLVEKEEKRMSFDQHVDKPHIYKKAMRGILSLGNPSGKDRKIMRITDRMYGRWVDIVIDHGTFIEMDLVYSGAINGRYTHEIRDATGVYSIIMDYGDVEKTNKCF